MIELFGFSFDEVVLLGKAIEVGLWAVATFLSVKIIPRIPRWLDDWVDQFHKMDLSEHAHKELANAIRFAIYIIAFYALFLILGASDVFGNKYYQLILLFFAMKISLAILRPSIRKIDDKMDSIDLSEHTHKMIESIISYTVYTISFFAALSILGYTSVFTGFIAGAGVLGITIGFAAKDVVSNTLAGIFIAFDKPLRYGEVVEIQGNLGIVDEIGLRMTKLRTFDNKVIMIPNLIINSNPVVNYTREKQRRIEVDVGIAYESDLKTAMELMKKVPEKIKGVILNNSKKPIQVILQNFGASSIDLQLLFWIDTRKGDLVNAKSDAKKIILNEFSKHDVEIPYPKQVIISESSAKLPPFIPALKKIKNKKKKNSIA